MGSSTEIVASAWAVALLAACNGMPSKGRALEIVARDVKEEASCVLPISTLAQLKRQHRTKAMCVPKEGTGASAAQRCVEALVAGGVTTAMPPAYMADWPDDVASASLDDVPAYDRRARNLVYQSCIAIGEELREGRFRCGEARADRVLSVTRTDDRHTDVRYARALSLDPKLGAIDAACGGVTRPPSEMTVTLEKTDREGKGDWVLAPPAVAYH